MVIPFDRKEKSVVPTLKNPSVKVVLPKENYLSPKIIEPLKRDALAKIIGALLRVVM